MDIRINSFNDYAYITKMFEKNIKVFQIPFLKQ